MDWLSRFHDSLEEGQLLSGVKRLLVGVSGGADSTALFLLLVDLRDSREMGSFPELLAGHVHHGLRGREADLDARFVEELARARGVECLVAMGDARKDARGAGLSPEAAARDLRYGAFRRWVAERAIEAIALGHQRDDQAETVLLRAIRGAGVRGIAGIPRVRILSEGGGMVRVIRPLLGWRREEILAYLKEKGQAFRVDQTNLDAAVPRNRIRLEVLPLLEAKVQAGAVESLARLAEVAAGLREDLRRLANGALEKARVPGPDWAVDVSVRALADLPDSVILEVLHLALESLAPASSRIRGEEGIHIPGSLFRTVLGWIGPRGPNEARASFGRRGGLTHSLELRYGLIRIRSEDAHGAAPEDAAEEIPLPLDETVEWARWRLIAQEAAHPSAPKAPGWLEERVDAESVASAGLLRVRSRREGDRIRPLGAPGTKSLKEFFRERRVRPSERGTIPLIVAGETIVWVVGHRIDHRFRLRPETTRTLVLRALAPGDPRAGAATERALG